ncbi:hypothetical protein E0I74_06385 [Rhizobium laguerreae]|jgi:hypothetical protein|uniref:Uncharacterized protein n=1 Tax=Rhizobium laguerreae TaxID=1076926 RepID=A0AAJ3AD16_9HYPH|nr:hypothetical protein [Rhizobium laguerreae]MBN9981090.1 hypothetical protein [Rhizobium laguerreae]MBY3062686.1 hypothetical protein [Rhizobium laguerreae]MBY3072758.1 hypothetical protein [Rhizobium laguerreae]MBY3076932.1 hypothetical protein [Rhizobium laguerreae]MBY3085277.1 hypothetical protein [Rhizobium laguerreae]
MTQHSGITKPALQPADVAMLQAVLRGWCQEKSCGIASPAAQHVARELVSWFECGIRDQRKLSDLMRYMHFDFKSLPVSTEAPRRESVRSAANISETNVL